MTLYEIEMIKDIPQVNTLYHTEINEIQANYKIHSGLRYRDGEVMILIDSVNFYTITLKDNKITTLND